jgi:hypothetical protein
VRDSNLIHPFDTKPFRFDGVNCLHENKINKTQVARVSFDFRGLPFSFYQPANHLAVANSKLRFTVGEYYDEYTHYSWEEGRVEATHGFSDYRHL